MKVNSGETREQRSSLLISSAFFFVLLSTWIPKKLANYLSKTLGHFCGSSSLGAEIGYHKGNADRKRNERRYPVLKGETRGKAA